jgi:hypothetical protein
MNNINISARDRVLRAWENSMELVRDYQRYADEMHDVNLQCMFKKFAKDEGYRAAELRNALLNMQQNGNQM